ncbi:hypothetical protein EV426DRAFT_618912 [Tirmania nivea]|nr:hypothetical protein EV426DRAFT_618912 [Tirmania nivea]
MVLKLLFQAGQGVFLKFHHGGRGGFQKLTRHDFTTTAAYQRTKQITSYSKMSIRQAEKRLGFRLESVKAVPVDKVLVKQSCKEMDAIKEKVYDRLVEYLDIEGYPTEASADFKEAKVSDLIYSTLAPILARFKHNTGRDIRLEREKDIISVGGKTGGMEEFVVMDRISVTEERFVLIVEAKRASTGQAIKQCVLSLKDAWDNNEGGEVYGFVTSGEQWRMIKFDGKSFVATEAFMVLFESMKEDKKRWTKNYSVVVDCVYVALSGGGIIKDEVVKG